MTKKDQFEVLPMSDDEKKRLVEKREREGTSPRLRRALSHRRGLRCINLPIKFHDIPLYFFLILMGEGD